MAQRRSRRPVHGHSLASDRGARTYTPSADELGMIDGGEPGTLVAHHGIAVEVAFDEGRRRLVKVARNSGHVVGDRVEVLGEILRRHPRRNALRRRDASGRVRVVAANLDLLGIVVAPRPATPAGFVDRALVAAHVAGLEPVIVLNKSDLAECAELEASLRSGWPKDAGGRELALIRACAHDPASLDGLRSRIAGPPAARAVLIGTSGVGKSSLTNSLVPELALGVAEINPGSGLGRHTTTTATLHELPRGGELVDTPGFREFGLVEVGRRDLALAFPGFVEILAAGACRFADCVHRAEPDCAIKAALDEGRLTPARWRAYCALLDES